MLNPEDFFVAGKIQKLFGYKGEVIVSLDSELVPDELTVEFFFLLLDGGLVPFEVTKLEPRGQDSAIVKFTDISSEQKAKAVIGQPLYLPKSLLSVAEEDRIYYHQLTGFKVFDHHLGEIGKVEEIRVYPEQDLMLVRNGDDEILIPMVEEFIVQIDLKHQKIELDLPEGLADLNK